MTATQPEKRILVLDDEPLILIDLRDELLDAGLAPSIANSVPKALSLIDTMEFDAAVLDVKLGGDSTCEPVATALHERGVPFLLHSGDLARRGEVISAMDVPILPKPTPGHQIAEVVLSLLEDEPADRARADDSVPAP